MVWSAAEASLTQGLTTRKGVVSYPAAPPEGRAVHAALTQNFAQKLDTYEDQFLASVRYSGSLGLRNGNRRNFEMTKTHPSSPYVGKPWSPNTWNSKHR
jgi:hypothetical protein